MKLFPVHSILWSSLLVLYASQSELEDNHDVCMDEIIPDELFQIQTTQQDQVETDAMDKENFLCLLYPTNELNCSWSFNTLQKDTQLFVYIRICVNSTTVPNMSHYSEERVGSTSLILHEHEMLHVILQFNITRHDKWTVYTYTYDEDMLEVLLPPQNISVSVKDGNLLVTWALPHSRVSYNPSCFDYQLEVGDQGNLKNLDTHLSYKEPNADPSETYRVRMRTRPKDTCQSNPQWSDWSHPVTVEQSIYSLNILVILSISLGIPMILLAVLLLVRYQRVSKVLFPPIPRPPLKYIYFLEKNDTSNFFYPAPAAEPVEEITTVEDTEQDPGKTS
ncbi:granulocyte-macrophage colony-stimulating factor receptor subunit alpha-like [Morone saxatilis]|uniref:granulocyte-macrophage colony-stimulating factor receptor subunit alpha-like n=1 Tax=Morone saxatilis TaxID=34816 RepID=UPI0015E20E12|nr:granulocyte-macrophage colony-stimulating factor receptor subunit alpha-like [Morone saxatilis]